MLDQLSATVKPISTILISEKRTTGFTKLYEANVFKNPWPCFVAVMELIGWKILATNGTSYQSEQRLVSLQNCSSVSRFWRIFWCWFSREEEHIFPHRFRQMVTWTHTLASHVYRRGNHELVFWCLCRLHAAAREPFLKNRQFQF